MKIGHNPKLKKNMSKIPAHIVSNLMPNFCDKCGAKYDNSDLELVDGGMKKATFKLTCRSCHNSYMIQVQNPSTGLLEAKRMPFKTDVNSEEFAKFSDSKQIEADEILDVYASIEKVQTIKDFDRLFKAAQSESE
jgi:hypothetical protein